MKMPTAKKGAGHAPNKPHIRMRKLKPVAASAFPQAPMAFPPPGDPSGGAPDPTQAMAGPAPGGMPSGAGPGDMGQ